MGRTEIYGKNKENAIRDLILEIFKQIKEAKIQPHPLLSIIISFNTHNIVQFAKTILIVKFIQNDFELKGQPEKHGSVTTARIMWTAQ